MRPCEIQPRRGSAADQGLESGLVADRVEVGVPDCHVATALPHLDRPAEVLDGVGSPAREVLAAGHVVVEVRLIRAGLDQLTAPAASAYLPAS